MLRSREERTLLRKVTHELAWCKLQISPEASCLDSYAGTITRLRNRQLEGGKKVMFLCKSLFRSQRHIMDAYAESQAIFHRKLPVHDIEWILKGTDPSLKANTQLLPIPPLSASVSGLASRKKNHRS